MLVSSPDDLCYCTRQADGTFPPITRTLNEEGNLTIHGLGLDDHGVYECVASNVVTSVIITSLLLIESQYIVSVEMQNAKRARETRGLRNAYCLT